MTIHDLDRALTKLAAKRETLAHDPIEHAQIDAAWSRTDQERQDLLSKMTDQELCQYEIDREVAWRGYPMTRKQKLYLWNLGVENRDGLTKGQAADLIEENQSTHFK